MEDDDLVTLGAMQRELALDQTTVFWLRRRLAKVAIEHVGRRGYSYPRRAILEELRLRSPHRDNQSYHPPRAVRGTAFGVGGFPPAPDLVFCPCGRSFIDDAALGRHVERDHDGIAPAQTDTPPRYRYTFNDVVEEQGMERPGTESWRNAFITTNRHDARSA